tara:strand:- start:413 stop:1234 length:822 start_codon:yes stop_codon:yes gene_type:complete
MALVLGGAVARAQTSLGVPESPIAGIVDQRDYSDSINGCGPASILNLLKFSKSGYQEIYHGLVGSNDGVRMRFVVDRYFRNRRSVVHPDQKRWGPHGIQTADLVTGLNELLADGGEPRLKGQYLDREEGESAGKHLARSHDMIVASLKNGVMPVLSLRSYVVRNQDEGAISPAWETSRHHNLVVTSVPRPPSSAGFEVIALDPWMGRAVELYFHIEGNAQAFRALKGVSETGEWLSGEPFLQVVAPESSSLQPLDLKWSERFIVVANFLIGDF